MTTRRQQLGFPEHFVHQFGYIHRRLAHSWRTGLERGQGEQFLDQPLHAGGLLARKGQEVNDILTREIVQAVYQRLEEAADHRKRRAQLVRHIGDEVPPHILQALEL